MELIVSRDVARKALQSARASGASVAFVPTMGALHEGHISLMRAARRDCGYVAVSIFVNPAQFGDAADLAAYPRDLDADLAVCAAAGVDAVFAPSVAEMYPEGSLDTAVVPGALAEVLEGLSRPGHFTGVATIVTKLLSIAGRCRAYFGEKDFQQLAIVRRLAEDLDLPVEVVGCPTVREPDGLATSSRNARLGPAERAAAGALFRALSAGARAVAGGERSGATVSAVMADVLAAEPLVVADYAAVADPATLQAVVDITAEVRLLVAAGVGPVRLIDNLAASPASSGAPPALAEAGR
ncbi:MAG TPA: pantoate--beta-alanine ligase [Acidimicrobiales bacterium]|nr:pantoate--beta-alanine ligase [Acidimicrobiales bacterium]